MYIRGVQYNIELAKEIYPGWICRIYLFQECFYLEKKLLQYNNVELVKIDEIGSSFATIQRFLPIGESDIDYFICRDADSRLSLREKEAVDEWLLLGNNFHIMKDHPHHYCDEFPILAGMWGAKGNLIPNIKELIAFFIKNENNVKGVDQRFLYYIFHNYAKDNFLEHGINNFPSARNFNRDNIYFVGQQFDENNNFFGDWKTHLKLLNIEV